MGFLEDLKNGDFKSIVLVIFAILLFNLYWCASRNSRSKKEPMTNVSNDIKAAISTIYKADVESIRNLANLSKKIQDGGLTLPGNLTVQGQIKSGGEISNNSLSLSGLNSKIDSINSSLSSSITNNNSNLTSQISSINSQISNKINKDSTISLEDISNPGFKLGTISLERNKVLTSSFDRFPGPFPISYYRKWKISDA